MKDVFKLPVFPAADVFPMMTDDELVELAEDIKANSLHEPLVVANIDTPDTPKHPKTMMLIDGRNRRKACKLAGIEPTTRELNKEDPTAYVISANIHRRHMTKGQRAIAVAMVLIGREYKNYTLGVSKQYVSFARTVLANAPDLAANVLSGAESLDAAYKIASDRKTAASSEEIQLADLRKRYPELADKVVEGELTLPGARAEADERDQQETELRKLIADGIWASLRYVHSFSNDNYLEKATVRLADDNIRAEIMGYVSGGEDRLRDLLDGFDAGALRLSKLMRTGKKASDEK